ncbi:YbaB/EbfC family nucleoid-associated protein [Nocardia sp. 2]|uniref:YbaB/EbfC family nucleoid-associated protein n=1 Tax=Nocardia acididurans TaxID=2802282 RepID=A0ABS1MHE5_9NOCA|nr:YbaB/EbfC family nucleoid-associated protein [Nocardia acididurans]MBL1080042.1 YbaB/EbfC family nucleoid-associated protein [Nocardia acididurans]
MGDSAREQEQFERELVEVRRRINRVAEDCRRQEYRESSVDGLARVLVGGTGEVLDIVLPRGFGDLNRPAWALGDEIDAAARAIVSAVNAARSRAAEVAAQRFSDEFPFEKGFRG